MSARDDLFHAVLAYIDRAGYVVNEADHQWADERIDAFAHELAEKIRHTSLPECKDDYSYFRENGADWAANLIDPEVTA
jgi:hypothetical protein